MNLKDEIVAGESYSLEFKRVPNEDREKYLKPVVAFAHGKGGRILFGVANDRTVVGIPNERIFAEMDGIVDSSQMRTLQGHRQGGILGSSGIRRFGHVAH